MRKYVVLLFLLFTSFSVAQVPNLTSSIINFGSISEFYNARSMAMGNSGIAGGLAIHGAMINPALLTRSDYQAEFSGLAYLRSVEEDRSYPYYDNFGGFVDYGSYVFNSNTYGDFALNAILKLPVLTSLNLHIGLGFNPMIDFNYDYQEEVRSTNFGDALLAYNKILSDGIFREVCFTIAANLIPDFSVGVKLGVITGSVNQKLEIFPVDESLNGIHQLETSEISLGNSPLHVDLGFHYQVHPQFAVAAVFKLPLSMDLDYQHVIRTNNPDAGPGLPLPENYIPQYSAFSAGFDSTAQTSFTRSLQYPLRLGFGIDYRFTNILEARIHADFEYTFWSNFDDNLNRNLKYSDTYAIRIGVEHIFFDKMPFRVGFSYQPLKENRQYTRALLTLGIGILFDDLQIDLSGGLENLTTNQYDLFDDGNYPPLESRADLTDRVQNNFLYGMIEFRYGLNNLF